MALIVSARTRAERGTGLKAGLGPVYDEYREVIPTMADNVMVKGPNHGEGQAFKMERKEAEEYVAANPGAEIVAGGERPANGNGEAEQPEKPASAPQPASAPAPAPASAPAPEKPSGADVKAKA